MTIFSQTNRSSRSLILLFFGLLGHALPVSAQQWEQVSALFEERCIACHSGEFAPLGLQLDGYDAVIAGSENGPVVQPGDAEGSALIARVEGRAEPQMPLDGPPFLSPEDIAALREWIDAGALGPAEPRAAPATPEDPFADGMITYSEVRRIFGQRCIECHSDNGKYETPPEGLRLDTLDNILKGGDRAAVIPRNPAASEVIRRVRGLADPRMPFDGPPWLDEADIALLEAWIAGGAKDDDGTDAPVPVGARVRLRGILTADDAVDGARFVVNGGTDLRGTPRIGGQVELRARIGQDGSLIAERLRDR